MDLTQAEQGALIEALKNGHLLESEVIAAFSDDDRMNMLFKFEFSRQKNEKEAGAVLRPAGTLVAQLLKEQEPRWVPLKEAGVLKPGEYFVLPDLHGQQTMKCGVISGHNSWTLRDSGPTHILHHGNTPVIVPEVKL